jgi:hypothetical protein
MNTTDATVFNPLSKPMALVEINSGTIRRLDFNLIGDDYKAKGIVRLLYDDLKVKILKKEEEEAAAEEEEEATYKPKKMMSLLANMKILDANPAKNKPVRIVSVNYQRNVYKSMFNLIWKSIFDGVQQTVGIDRKM